MAGRKTEISCYYVQCYSGYLHSHSRLPIPRCPDTGYECQTCHCGSDVPDDILDERKNERERKTSSLRRQLRGPCRAVVNIELSNSETINWIKHCRYMAVVNITQSKYPNESLDLTFYYMAVVNIELSKPDVPRRLALSNFEHLVSLSSEHTDRQTDRQTDS